MTSLSASGKHVNLVYAGLGIPFISAGLTGRDSKQQGDQGESWVLLQKKAYEPI